MSLGGPIKRDTLHHFLACDGQDYENPSFRHFADFPEGREHEWENITGLDWESETGILMQTRDVNAVLIKADWQISASNLLTVRDNWSEYESQNTFLNYTNVGRPTARDQNSNERSTTNFQAMAEDQYNLDGEWGPSSFDVEHKLVVADPSKVRLHSRNSVENEQDRCRHVLHRLSKKSWSPKYRGHIDGP